MIPALLIRRSTPPSISSTFSAKDLTESIRIRSRSNSSYLGSSPSKFKVGNESA